MVDITQSTVHRGNIPGIKTIFGLNYEQLPTIYSKFYKIATSDKMFEESMGLFGTGLMMEKSEGGELSHDYLGQGNISRLVHGMWGKVISFTRQSMINYQYSPKLQDLVGKFFAASVQQSKEVLAHSPLNDGFSTVTNNVYINPDAVALFSASHPSNRDGSLRSNLLTNAAPVSQNTIEQMCLQIYQATDDAGINLRIMPKQYIIPITEYFNIDRIMNSSKESGSFTNNKNTMLGLGVEIIPSPFITSSTASYITTNVDNGLVMYNREDVEIEQDKEFLTKNELFSIYLSFSYGYEDWRAAWGTPGA